MLLQKLLPADGGIIYTETDLTKLFPEPLNMISATFFVAIAVYWIFKLKGFSPKHTLLSIATYILLIGSIGGTLYHGFRMHSFFILMDWLPILILITLVTAYFWSKVTGSWLYTIIILMVIVAVEYVAYKLLSSTNMNLANNVNYAMLVLSAILPLALFLERTRFKYAKWVLAALTFFGVALFFRISDSWMILDSGTHFLWHTFGMLATQSIFVYLYKINQWQIQIA
jgi:hemolysin III